MSDAILAHLYPEHASITSTETLSQRRKTWTWTCKVCGAYKGGHRSEYQAVLDYRRHRCSNGKASA